MVRQRRSQNASAKISVTDQETGATAVEVETSPRIEQPTIESGPLTQYLGYYLRRLYEAYRRHFLDVASEFDFGPREVGAAFVIGLNPGLTPSQLREALAMDGAQITALLNTFERRGYIERRVSPTDGRSRHVFLTAEGGALLARLRSVVGWFDQSFSAGALDDEEMTELLRLLAKLHAATAGL